MAPTRTAVLLQLFGAAGVWRGGVRQQALPDSLPGYLAVYLASRGEGFSREALAAIFWPERAEADAQRSLRVNLHRLRALLTTVGLEQSLRADRHRVCLAVDTDVSAFKDALGRADWQQAVALQPAPLLATMRFRGVPLVEAWARSERETLASAGQTALLRFAQQAEQWAREQPSRPAQIAQVAHVTDPTPARLAAQGLLRLPAADLNDLLVQALLRLAPAAACVPEALLAYDSLCRQLHDEWGQAPQPATRELAHALKVEARLPPALALQRPASVPRSIEQPPRLVGRETPQPAPSMRGCPAASPASGNHSATSTTAAAASWSSSAQPSAWRQGTYPSSLLCRSSGARAVVHCACWCAA